MQSKFNNSRTVLKSVFIHVFFATGIDFGQQKIPFGPSTAWFGIYRNLARIILCTTSIICS